MVIIWTRDFYSCLFVMDILYIFVDWTRGLVLVWYQLSTTATEGFRLSQWCRECESYADCWLLGKPTVECLGLGIGWIRIRWIRRGRLGNLESFWGKVQANTQFSHRWSLQLSWIRYFLVIQAPCLIVEPLSCSHWFTSWIFPWIFPLQYPMPHVDVWGLNHTVSCDRITMESLFLDNLNETKEEHGQQLYMKSFPVNSKVGNHNITTRTRTFGRHFPWNGVNGSAEASLFLFDMQNRSKTDPNQKKQLVSITLSW
jgi:hypothetical protein